MPEEELQPQASLNEAEVTETPDQPQTADEPTTDEPQVAESPSTEADGSEDKKPSRAQRKIGDLTRQLKAAQEEKEALRQQQEAYAFYNQTPTAEDPWKAYESGEITMEQLQKVVQTTSQQSAQFAAQVEAQKLRAELAEKEFWGNMEKDVRELESSNPIFNPTSAEFDAEYVEELSQLYTEAYGKDTQSLQKAPKLSTFVSRIEKLRARAEEQGVSRSSAQLAEQAAQGAVIGTGGSVSSKGSSKEALKQKGMQSGDFKDYFKTMASE